MTTSIVIPHYGNLAYTEACVDAVEMTTDDYDLIVVDNGTGDDLPGTVIRNETNLGFAAACNQGAEKASGHIVFLNNDTEPRSGWLPPLIAHLERGAGVVGSQLVYPDGRLQHAGVWLYRNSRGVLTAENRRAEFGGGLVEAVTGACMAVRRDAFDEAGGFDEGYWNGYEDVDLCLTVRAAGWRVVYEPVSLVMHHESASGPERWAGVVPNIRRLQEKWADYEPAGEEIF